MSSTDRRIARCLNKDNPADEAQLIYIFDIIDIIFETYETPEYLEDDDFPWDNIIDHIKQVYKSTEKQSLYNPIILNRFINFILDSSSFVQYEPDEPDMEIFAEGDINREASKLPTARGFAIYEELCALISSYDTNTKQKLDPVLMYIAKNPELYPLYKERLQDANYINLIPQIIDFINQNEQETTKLFETEKQVFEYRMCERPTLLNMLEKLPEYLQKQSLNGTPTINYLRHKKMI